MACTVGAQQPTKPPKTSRTVYKCQVGDQVNYSDAPCLGAQKVDVTPTRGMDRDSGQKRTGSDVRSERTQEQLAGIMQAATGITPEQRATLHRRSKLTPAVKRECAALDELVAELEVRERAAGSQTLLGIQQALLADRTQHRKLAC